MPIYEYVCKSCSHKFELLRSFSRSSEGADCPRCKKQAERIISTCYTVTTSESGIPQALAGGGSSCGSCSSGNCSTCHS